MKKINDEMFKKSEIYNLNSIMGGSSPTTKHDPTLQQEPGGEQHYTCDHSKDTVELTHV